jgi:hypothetical protein
MSTWREAAINGAKLGKRRTTIPIVLLFSASQIRAKELHFGGSKAELRGLCPTSLTRITKTGLQRIDRRRKEVLVRRALWDRVAGKLT